MKKETRRCITELVLGFLVTAAVTAMILFWQYETYQENLASRARLLLAENPAEEVFQILKEDGDLNTEEVQDILGDYGYEDVYKRQAEDRGNSSGSNQCKSSDRRAGGICGGDRSGNAGRERHFDH